MLDSACFSQAPSERPLRVDDVAHMPEPPLVDDVAVRMQERSHRARLSECKHRERRDRVRMATIEGEEGDSSHCGGDPLSFGLLSARCMCLVPLIGSLFVFGSADFGPRSAETAWTH